MTALKNLSFKSCISLIMVAASLVSSVVIGTLGWSTGRASLEESIGNQLTSIRVAHAYQIESYFDQLIAQTRTLAENRMVVNAMRQLRAGFDEGMHADLTQDQETEVRNFYGNVFTKKLGTNRESTPLSIMFEPKHAVANYFQYHYLVSNPFPVESKDMMSSSETDQTVYSKFHRFYQPLFRRLLKEFNLYDIFLIDLKSLSVTYSVFKETDFATSLIDGPHQDSALGLLAKRIRDEPTRGNVLLSDYRPYAPSYGAPAAFLGAPIFDGNTAVGILVIQIPDEEINRSMTYSGEWLKSGLGDTGESYLVGSDKLMRSDARALIEDRDAFLKEIKKTEFLDRTQKGIQSFGTTNSFMPSASESTVKALNGGSGIHISENYLGESVLSSYAPLKIPGLDWIIISEMSEQEAFAPIANLQRNIVIWGIVLILAVSLLSIIVSHSVMRPIEALTAGVMKLRAGQEDVVVRLDSEDELGTLASSFNDMVEKIREKSQLIETKTRENERLLRNTLPDRIIERIETGEPIADNLQQVTVVYFHTTGLDTVGVVSEQAMLLDRTLERLSELGERFEVERIKTIGNTLVFGCGVTRTRLDHSRQTVVFALAAQTVLDQINAENQSELGFKTGIATGPLVSAVVGTQGFNYEIWGQAADEAARIRFAAGIGQILVTNAVRQKINDNHNFVPVKPLDMDGTEIAIFELQTSPPTSLRMPDR